jgi:hypothetical protein
MLFFTTVGNYTAYFNSISNMKQQSPKDAAMSHVKDNIEHFKKQLAQNPNKNHEDKLAIIEVRKHLAMYNYLYMLCNNPHKNIEKLKPIKKHR